MAQGGRGGRPGVHGAAVGQPGGHRGAQGPQLGGQPGHLLRGGRLRDEGAWRAA